MQNTDMLVPAFLEQKKRDGVRESTLKRIETNSKAFLMRNNLGIETMVEEFRAINDETFQKFLDSFEENTHNSWLVHLNAMRKFAGMKKLDRKRRKVAEKPALLLDDAEVVYQKMRAACQDDRDRAVLVLMRHGGLREGEIVLLEASNFKFLAQHVELHFYRPKTETWGDVVIHDGVPDIERFVKGKNGRLFDISEKQLWRIVHDASIRAGVTWNPHKFRHFRATELGKNGNFTKWDLDNMFGWKHSGNTASVYVNLSNDETKQKILQEGGIMKRPEPDDVKKLRCRRCAAVLGKDEIASGRCPICQSSTKTDDFIAELKSRENLESQMLEMKNQMASVMVAMNSRGFAIAANRESRDVEIKKN